ncbi:MFS transporter [Pontibacillus yanchengensis]|uniref:MFS transporter n=1 Tax=Pontibacillus yanchengensis Y32 TaxID=1385514 RepID=A0A0A2TAV1_9BACI|nr:MFS transporter [Pontibacillus yanchengensis]KGP71196.1 MFS transporter [Pontibacillus yanchengensis Y32]
MKEKKWDLFALASIPLLMTLGNSMLIPVLPIMEKEIGITSFQSSLIITIYSVIAIPLIPISGYLSDKWGRKKVIIPCLIIVGIGGALAAFAAWKIENPLMLILIGRFIQGVGASGAFPVVIPTVGDMFKDEEEVSKGLGIIETANTFGKVLSPIIGALLAVILWFIPFVAIPVLALIAILLVMVLVKVPKEGQQEETHTFKEFLHLIKDLFKKNSHWLSAIFISGGIFMFVLFGFLFHFSNLLEDEFKKFGYVKGLLLAVPLLFLCASSYIAGSKVGQNKQTMKKLILIGHVVAAIALVFVQGEMLLRYLLLLSIAGTGIGVALPCLDAYITEGTPKEERGTITALYSSMRFVGVAAGPPVIAVMMKSTPTWIYYLFAILCLISFFISWWAIKPDEQEA